MKNLFTLSAITFLSLLGMKSADAQKTWLNIRDIMVTKCAGNDCHGDSTQNPSFNVDSSAADLYDQLINGTPVNGYADSVAGFKLVVPNDARRSYLLRKIARCVNGSLEMAEEEGEDMPDDGNPVGLPDSTVELIYQWIIQGASETAVISPDTVAGDVCDIFLAIRPLPAHEVSFTVSPNPVSGVFTVGYTIKNGAQVSVELFDSKGVKTSLLSQSSRTSGTHRETYHAGDMPKGVYFIRLTVGADQYLKKMVVL